MEGFSFYALWTALGIFMIIYYLRRSHTLRSALWGMFTGFAGLILLHYFGSVLGYSPELNLFNISTAGILGIPGVVLMLIMHFVII